MTFSGSKKIQNMYEPIDPNTIKSKLEELAKILNIELSNEMMDFLLFNPLLIKYQSLCNSLKKLNELKNYDNNLNKLNQYYATREIIDFTDPKYSVFDNKTNFPEDYITIAEIGAEGLFTYGYKQFEALKKYCCKIVNFVIKKKFESICLIESPLGNVIPVQILNHLLQQQKVKVSIISLSLPRNEKASAGHTLKSIVTNNIDLMTKNKDLVIYIDDIISGTRFKKCSNAIIKGIRNTSKKPIFLPCALVFKPLITIDYKEKEDYRRNKKSIKDNLKKIFNTLDFYAWFEMPELPYIKIDDGLPVTHGSPVIWGEQPLVAGKKKISFVFAIIEQFEGILDDLITNKKNSRDTLEKLWSEDTNGQTFKFENGLTKKIFTEIQQNLDWNQIRDEAKVKFKDDYNGSINKLEQNDVEIRMKWIKESLHSKTQNKLNEGKANILIKAISNIFDNGIEYYPAHRDSSYCNCFFQYHDKIARINQKIVDLIINDIDI